MSNKRTEVLTSRREVCALKVLKSGGDLTSLDIAMNFYKLIFERIYGSELSTYNVPTEGILFLEFFLLTRCS
jgi:hypothetical protein